MGPALNVLRTAIALVTPPFKLVLRTQSPPLRVPHPLPSVTVTRVTKGPRTSNARHALLERGVTWATFMPALATPPPLCTAAITPTVSVTPDTLGPMAGHAAHATLGSTRVLVATPRVPPVRRSLSLPRLPPSAVMPPRSVLRATTRRYPTPPVQTMSAGSALPTHFAIPTATPLALLPRFRQPVLPLTSIAVARQAGLALSAGPIPPAAPPVQRAASARESRCRARQHRQGGDGRLSLYDGTFFNKWDIKCVYGDDCVYESLMYMCNAVKKIIKKFQEASMPACLNNLMH